MATGLADEISGNGTMKKNLKWSEPKCVIF